MSTLCFATLRRVQSDLTHGGLMQQTAPIEIAPLALAEEMEATLRSDLFRTCFVRDSEGNVFELVEHATA